MTIEHDTAVNSDLWRRVLRGEEAMQEYFAERSSLGSAALFTCPPVEEFNLAVVDDVQPGESADVLAEIERHYAERSLVPRVRLSPLAADPAWPDLLARAGYVETGERRRFWTVPDPVRLAAAPGVIVTRATTPEEADLFSAVQADAYAFAPEVREWDRRLARRHVAAGRNRFYLAWLDGEVVGVAGSMPLAPGVNGLWGLATLPRVRRLGVGRTLLGQKLDDIHAAGGGLILLTTAWDNPIADSYVRFGFVPLFDTRTFARRTV